MAASQVYVITGGTRGIGFGLARELLARGQQVFICGRSQEAVEQALRKLSSDGKVQGATCDVTRREEVQALWDAAVAAFGRVDVWINNAGVDPHISLLEASPETVDLCVDVNMKGAIYGCQVAMKGMQAQQGMRGRIYLVEGFGTDGRIGNAKMSLYGATKYGNAYLANAFEAIAKEGTGSVTIGRVQPGMVVTDLLRSAQSKSSDGDPEKAKKQQLFLNILADKESTVTPWLAEQLVQGKTAIRWLTPGVVLGRFLGHYVCPCCCSRKEDVFAA